MKAAVYYSNSDIRIEDVDDLAVGPGEIKVTVLRETRAIDYAK